MPATQAIWQKTKTGGKAGFDKVWGWADKLGAPVNKLSNKLGSGRQPWIKNPTRRRGFYEASVVSLSPLGASEPANAGPEDGFYQEEVHQTADGPKQKQKVLKKIPPEVCLYHFTDLK
jgi:hypothetical protein